MEFFGVTIETWFLTIPFFFYFGVFFHEISHGMFAVLTRCSNVEISFFNKEKNMSVSYNTDAMWKVRVIGLAPIITAFGVLVFAYLLKGQIGWGSGSLIFGLVRYTSWTDIFPLVATGGTVRPQEIYNRTQRGIKILTVALLIWVVVGIMVKSKTGWGPFVIETVGGLVSLMSFYYGAWVYFSYNTEPINTAEEMFFIRSNEI